MPACSRPSELPPTCGHLLRMGANVTYLAHRTLLPGQTLVREYAKSETASRCRCRHGSPLRLRVETQLGYKSLTYLTGINVTDTFDDHGKSGSIQHSWSWYAGI